MINSVEAYNGLNVTFNITEDCNLKCKYCYELDKQPNDMPLEYAQKFIDILLEDPDPIGAIGTDMEWILNQGLILDFIGGDALMRPKLMDQILSYFIFKSTIVGHKWANRWRASISSNGTLFREPGVKEFLYKYRNNLSLGVSVDGCPEIHDKNRDNSIMAILDQWEWYLEFAGSSASTKSTLNRDSIPYLYKSLQFLYETMRLQQINQNFIFEPMDLTSEDLNVFEQQMEKCVQYTLDRRDSIYWSMIDKRFTRNSFMSEPDKGWCGAGSMPTIGVNGKIYPCFRFMPHTMSSRELDFSVGDIWTGFSKKENFEIVRKQTREKISPQKCFDCPIEPTCAWCIGGAFSEKGNFYRQTNICETNKIQAKWATIYWKEYDKLEGTNSFEILEEDTLQQKYFYQCNGCSSGCTGTSLGN